MKIMKKLWCATLLGLLSTHLSFADVSRDACKKINLSGKKFGLFLDIPTFAADANVTKVAEITFVKDEFKPGTDETQGAYDSYSAYRMKVKLTYDRKLDAYRWIRNRVPLLSINQQYQ